jgi:hypothetical protein
MSANKTSISDLNDFGHNDLKGFASYLGMKYEDLLEIQKRNIESQNKYLKKISESNVSI